MDKSDDTDKPTTNLEASKPPKTDEVKLNKAASFSGGSDNTSALHIATQGSTLVSIDLSDNIKSPATPSLVLTPAPFCSSGESSRALSSQEAKSTDSPFTSSTPSMTQDIAHDLPSPLLHAGWRKFWSKRENRPYFYNKNTGESLWEMPPESSNHTGHDPQCNGNPQLKRRASQDGSGTPHITPIKRSSFDVGERSEERPSGPEHLLGSLWNSRVVSNVTHRKREPTIFLPPNPQIEWERADLMARLRQQYVNICKSREGIVPISGSFNRWNLQMKVENRGFDPMFPSNCTVGISESMKRELLFALPTPLKKPKFANEARNQLMKYAESAKTMVDTRNATPESRKTVKWNVDDTIRWLRTEKYLTFDDLNDRLAHLKRTCQPHIAEMAKDSVEKICLKVYTLSHEFASHLREIHIQWLEKVGVHLPEDKKMADHTVPRPLAPPEGNNETPQQFTSHPAPLLCSCPMASGLTPNPAALYPVMVDTTGVVDIVLIDFSGARFTLTRAHYDKLTQLYKRRAEDDTSLALFPQRLWCLLQRYQSYMGEVDGLANQAALPVPVFECLNRVFDVTFELFASPLNCYFPQFCSAFHDTDRYFGSCGPVLDFYPEFGSFEANPPFCEELLLSTVEHLEFILENTSLALSFIVFMPDWRDPPYEALTRLENSQFVRSKSSLRALEHEYRLVNCPLTSGQPAAPEVTQRSNHSTLIVFLQNEAGYTRWTPTPAKVKEIVTAYHAHAMKSKPQ